MMKLIFTAVFLASIFIAQAQPTNEKGWYYRKDVENVIVGWMNPLSFKEPAKPVVQNGWNYPAKQMDVSQKIATWMQQSYTCKGLLGELKQLVLAPTPALPVSNSSYVYNEAEKDNRKALPNTYGAYTNFHINIVKTATKKFWPMEGNKAMMTLNIMANNVELITRQIVSISSPDEYYCSDL